MWNCPYCNTENWDTTSTCTRCKKPRSEPAPETIPPQTTVSSAAIPQSPPWDPPFAVKLRVLFSWALAFLPFFICFTVIFFLVEILVASTYSHLQYKRIEQKVKSEFFK